MRISHRIRDCDQALADGLMPDNRRRTLGDLPSVRYHRAIFLGYAFDLTVFPSINSSLGKQPVKPNDTCFLAVWPGAKDDMYWETAADSWPPAPAPNAANDAEIGNDE